jgi:predicted site-specific integrase-resolvase
MKTSFINIKQVAELLGKTKGTIHRWKNKGLLPFIRMPSGAIIFDQEAVIAKIKTMEVSSEKE